MLCFVPPETNEIRIENISQSAKSVSIVLTYRVGRATVTIILLFNKLLYREINTACDKT